MRTAPRMLTAVLAACLAAVLCGCIERRITIGSDPPGALVILNDVEVGRTPITVPFTWHGDYDLRFRLEKNVGTTESPQIRRYYLHTHRKTRVPWFDVLGVDLVTELLPVPFRHDEVWAFPLPEVQSLPDEELVERARGMKAQLQGGR